jgi:DNA-directed RNA polymerase specialized sigma24 family protein
MDNQKVDELTSKLHEDVIAMIQYGIRAQEIAEELGMSLRHVYRIARKAEQPMMYRRKRHSLLLNLLKEGKSYEEAGKILGLKPDSAYRMEYRLRAKCRSTHLKK